MNELPILSLKEVKTRSVRVLLVEEIPIISSNYKTLLKNTSSEPFSFFVEESFTVDAARNTIQSNAGGMGYDVIVLDLNANRSVLSMTEHGDAESLGILIRKEMPKTKILVTTSCNSHYRFYSAFRNFSPEGFVLKQELTHQEFIKATLCLLHNQNYYGPSITKYLSKQVSNQFKIDYLDRKLLYLLSNCLTTKEIADHLPISQSGVEKRKRNLSKFFNLEDAKTASLVRAAKENGFLS